MINVEKARLYEKYRLPYAPELVDGLLGQIGEIECVADIGAGTGQLARMFAGSCAKLYAVEPDPSMREVASSALGSPHCSQITTAATQSE